MSFLFTVLTPPFESTSASSSLCMFKEMAGMAVREKPLLKSQDLEVDKRYRILKLSRPNTGFGSLLVESENFFLFLPSLYKKAIIVPINESDDYYFSIDKLLPLKNDKFTVLLSFYNGQEKL